MDQPVSLDQLTAVLTGDSVADAVAQGRCLAAPVGCGASVFQDGTMRGDILDPLDEADYIAEWKHTGLCADCQDEREELEDRKVDRHTWATKAACARLDLELELLPDKRA